MLFQSIIPQIEPIKTGGNSLINERLNIEKYKNIRFIENVNEFQ
jgi:hypothetical protein